MRALFSLFVSLGLLAAMPTLAATSTYLPRGNFDRSWGMMGGMAQMMGGSGWGWGMMGLLGWLWAIIWTVNAVLLGALLVALIKRYTNGKK